MIEPELLTLTQYYFGLLLKSDLMNESGNDKNKIDLSVVIPTYGRSGQLDKLILETGTVLDKLNLNYEIIVVDDHSENNVSLGMQKHERLKLCRLAANVGQLVATIKGIQLARGNWIVTLDDDFQRHPRHIPQGLNYLKENGLSLVYGSEGYSTMNVNKAYKLIASALLFPKILNYEVTSFRVIDRNVLDHYSARDVIGDFWKIRNRKIGAVRVERIDKGSSAVRIGHLFRHQVFFISHLVKKASAVVLILAVIFWKPFLFVALLSLLAVLLLLEMQISRRLRVKLSVL